MEAEEPQPEDEDEYGVLSCSRQVAKKSRSEDDPLDVISPKGKSMELVPDPDDEEVEEGGPRGGRYALRSSRGRSKLDGLVLSDEEDGEAMAECSDVLLRGEPAPGDAW